jgi:uncharacterized protein with HEPN domain
MRRTYKLYLDDLLLSIDKILSYTNGLDYSEFIMDDKTLDAVIRNFEIIGIASKNIPEDLKGKYQAVEWKKITNFKNILAHEYFGIDYEILWEVIKDKLPEMRLKIQMIIDQET